MVSSIVICITGDDNYFTYLGDKEAALAVSL
jgi:hypothetical protein